MFTRIAVVNRGESAVRLIRAVRELNAEFGYCIEAVALHTEAFASWSATESAERAALDSAVGLAQVAFDYAADPQLRDAARAEFAELGKVSVEGLLRSENSQ